MEVGRRDWGICSVGRGVDGVEGCGEGRSPDFVSIPF